MDAYMYVADLKGEVKWSLFEQQKNTVVSIHVAAVLFCGTGSWKIGWTEYVTRMKENVCFMTRFDPRNIVEASSRFRANFGLKSGCTKYM